MISVEKILQVEILKDILWILVRSPTICCPYHFPSTNWQLLSDSCCQINTKKKRAGSLHWLWDHGHSCQYETNFTFNKKWMMLQKKWGRLLKWTWPIFINNHLTLTLCIEFYLRKIYRTERLFWKKLQVRNPTYQRFSFMFLFLKNY